MLFFIIITTIYIALIAFTLLEMFLLFGHAFHISRNTSFGEYLVAFILSFANIVLPLHVVSTIVSAEWNVSFDFFYGCLRAYVIITILLLALPVIIRHTKKKKDDLK